MTCSVGLIIKFTYFVIIEVYENYITFINRCIRNDKPPPSSLSSECKTRFFVKVCYFFLADTILSEFMPRLSFVLSVYRNKAWQTGCFLLRVEPTRVTLSPQLKQSKARITWRREKVTLTQNDNFKQRKIGIPAFACIGCFHMIMSIK